MAASSGLIGNAAAGARHRGPLAYHPDHPFAPPDRRWGRALELRDERLRARRFDDEWVRRARRFASALTRYGDDTCHPGVLAADPAVASAYRVYAASDPLPRCELEARLLAGQDDVGIADRVGLDIEAFAAFAALFFDVRNSLRAIDYIAACVLGRRFYDGSGFGDKDLAAKLLGFNFGPIAVDAHFGRQIPGTDVPSMAEALARYIRLATAPITERDAPRWLELTARLEEVEAARAADAAIFRPVVVPAAVVTTISCDAADIGPDAEPVSPIVERGDDMDAAAEALPALAYGVDRTTGLRTA